MSPLLSPAHPMVAISHALRESEDSIERMNFCSSLAMLRKAIDLWSVMFKKKQGMKFNRAKKEKDNLYWRLRKIADGNVLHRDAVHNILDQLRIDANDALHDESICIELSGSFEGSHLAVIKRPYKAIHDTVKDLVNLTYKGLM